MAATGSTTPTIPQGVWFAIADSITRDRLLLYSDAIVEARLTDGTRYGIDRLMKLVAATAHQEPSRAVAAIEHDVLSAGAGDDATQLLVAVE